jgi:hypothetical protein
MKRHSAYLFHCLVLVCYADDLIHTVLSLIVASPAGVTQEKERLNMRETDL